jgi:hypothetical protein
LDATRGAIHPTMGGAMLNRAQPAKD